MKPLYAKEIRLLQPAYLVALLLAIVPVWIFPSGPNDSPGGVAVVLFSFGAIMLALSPFGREFALGTFGLQLAQPEERRRIWRIKSGLLAAAMVSVFAVWSLSCAVRLETTSPKFIGSEVFLGGTLAAVLAFTGGLWTTLLWRQVSGAFWLTLGAPMLIGVVMHRADDWLIYRALGLYAVAGFWWARHLFIRAQDIPWTGGPELIVGRRGAAANPGARQFRPVAALFWREINLHQIALIGMPCLFLLHGWSALVRSLYDSRLSDTVQLILVATAALWLLVPFLVCAGSIAEERRLGTLAQGLSLPVSRRVQFGIKLGVALFIGGLLTPLLLITAEGIGQGIGSVFAVAGPAGSEEKVSVGHVAGIALLFLGLSFVCFYASTLARNVLQATGLAVACTIAIVLLAVLVFRPGPWMVPLPWRGLLIYYIGGLALIAALFWLAWRNFRTEFSSGQLWRSNALVICLALAGSALLTSAIYNRVWEFLTSTDPRPGPVQVLGSKPVLMQSYGGNALSVLLPDGRFWVDRFDYESGAPVFSWANNTGLRCTGHWSSLGGDEILPGSNWISVVANTRDTVAIRSDGTLWVSETPRQPGRNDGEQIRFEKEPPLVQVGSEKDWRVVVREHGSVSVTLLKQDGTLWRLGTNVYSAKVWAGLRSFVPRLLVSKADWDRIIGPSPLCAWTRDGSAWILRAPVGRETAQTNEMGVVLERAAYLDNSKWTSMAWFDWHCAGAREDGTLWAWQIESMLPTDIRKKFTGPHFARVGGDSDWASVAGNYGTLILRKTDGSIWRWTRRWEDRNATESPFTRPPVRLGSRHDWLAVAGGYGGGFSLGPDGALYFWWDRKDVNYYSEMDGCLAPPRKPAFIENIFGEASP
jgi:hypothetical protein